MKGFSSTMESGFQVISWWWLDGGKENILINIGKMNMFIELKNCLENYIDGPSNTLLKVIEEEGNQLSNWKGYR